MVRSYSEAKDAESRAYDNIYGNDQEFAAEHVRKVFLHESESRFIALLEQGAAQATVLEIGCGLGDHALLAARGAKVVVGIDISIEAVTRARARAEKEGLSERVSFEVVDVDSAPYAEGSFDVILDHEVFSSLDIALTLPKLHRLLKPGGRLIGIECLDHNPIFKLNRKLGVLRGRRTAWAASHVLKLQQLDTARGLFRRVEVEYYHLFLFLGLPFQILLGAKLSKPIVDLCRRLDRLIVHNRMLGRWAFKAVFVLEK